jgi:hypothetical protein
MEIMLSFDRECFCKSALVQHLLASKAELKLGTCGCASVLVGTNLAGI